MVDDQLKLGGLHHWQVRGLGTLEDTAAVDADMAIQVGKVRAVAHQSSGVDVFTAANDVGSTLRAARLASWTRRSVKNASGATKMASGCSRASVVKTISISGLVLALKKSIFSPRARAAASTSLSVDDAVVALVGLTSTATRAAAGSTSRKSPRRFATTSAVKKLIPVALPPGRARLATRPSLTGSSATPKTIGIVRVAALAASAATEPPGDAITLTCRCTKSATCSGNRSKRPSVKRYSMATFWPST